MIFSKKKIVLPLINSVQKLNNQMLTQILRRVTLNLGRIAKVYNIAKSKTTKYQTIKVRYQTIKAKLSIKYQRCGKRG